MKKLFAILLGFLAVENCFSQVLLDNFDDGTINPDLWTPYERDGVSVEEAGKLTFLLGDPISGSSFAGLRLQQRVSSNSDFNLHLNFEYDYTQVDRFLNFGVMIYQASEGFYKYAAGFFTDNTNTVRSSAFSLVEPTYSVFTGNSIESTNFSFDINYSASNKEFEFATYVEAVQSGSIYHSICGDQEADIWSDWDFSLSDQFMILIVAESFYDQIPGGILVIDNFELSIIPEPTSLGIVFSLIVIGVVFLGRIWSK